MPRGPRLEYAGAVHHVTARGNGGQDIYLDDRDRSLFLRYLAREVEQQGWRCYAYCLMGNHYHLLLETPEPNLGIGMRRLNGVFSQFINYRHDRYGHLFQGRFKSMLVEKESYLLELCRYVVLNPVRAGLVPRPEDWAWSSYRATVGLDVSPKWLDIDSVLDCFGLSAGAARQSYLEFVGEGMRASTPWKPRPQAAWLGGEDFRARLEELAKAMEPTSSRQRDVRPSRDDIFRAVAESYGVGESEILARRHQPAYQAVAYLLRRAASLPIAEVAREFQVTAPRISHIQKAVERGEVDEQLKQLVARFNIR